MAYDHKDVLLAQHNQLQNERVRLMAQYEDYRVNEDSQGVLYTADKIIEVDAKAAALERIANSYLAGQQAQPQGNRWGLSNDEVAIARGQFSGDRSMTNEQREELYARNKQKYQQARATGAYRDDQGTVRR